MKPHLASDFDENKLVFPLLIMPKIDGVRGCNFTGTLVGRSLKPHKNEYTTKLFSKPEHVGFDGELTCGVETSPSLCRDTTSAINTIKSTPKVKWHVFDYLTDETKNLPYIERHRILSNHVKKLQDPNIVVVPYVTCENLSEVLYFEKIWLLRGYEGVIIRSADGKHKDGRCTVKEGAYLRIKRFVDFEFVATSVVEAQANNNEKKTNALGKSERSSHKANKTPKGMIGSIVGNVLNDVIHPVTKHILFSKGTEVEVSAGCLTHKERKYYFDNQSEFFQQIHKASFFPVGIKDKLRFPTWQSFRANSDIE